MARELREASQELNIEPSILASGMWQFPTNPDLCCIYRVPDRLRQVNPKAYTPQLLIIGPLHHSLKTQALKRLEDINNTKFMGYLNMEQHKKTYLSAFTQRFVLNNTIDEEDILEGENIIRGFRRVIEEEEEAIRASYAESTTWIQSHDFVEMILHDSVFILEFILRCNQKGNSSENTGDILMDQPLLSCTVGEDLMLLENQLPYFILDKLFDPIINRLFDNQTLRTLFIETFGFVGKINDNSEFKHFTDLFRGVRVDSLKLEEEGDGEGGVNGVRNYKYIEILHNAEKLSSGGIKFKVIKEELSLGVKFENGCLELPSFVVQDDTEMILRNLMALEQCHYPYQTYVCNFIIFLDYLIDTEKDVDFLVEKGIVKNRMGDHGLVADMVNKLALELFSDGSNYYDIALKIEAHYKSRINEACALLKRVYFKDLWIGTATVAATLLLILTLTQTIISIMQVLRE